MYQFNDFEFFWGTEHPFSQWHPSKFVIKGIEYNSAEQYMMHQKAVLFGDEAVAKEILKEKDPRKQKALGRKVRGFDQHSWVSARFAIVYNGNYAKFTQNENLRKFLLGTEGSWIVEASPYDKIWGIGLGVNDKRSKNPDEWQGINLLGEVLMALRANLLAFS